MKQLLLAFTLSLLAGCASVIAPVPGESLASLRAERIAVAYTLAEKRIAYHEVLFRLLFLEKNAASQDFSGVWGADADLSDELATRLRQQGFQAGPLYRVVDAAVVQSFVSSWSKLMVSASTTTAPMNPSLKLPPPREFFLATPTDDAFTALCESLRSQGYRYMVHLSAMGVGAVAPGMGVMAIAAFPMGQVIDVYSAKVIWAGPFAHGESYQFGGDFRALEVDNMKATKIGMAAGIRKLDFASAWGLPAAK